MDKISRTFLLEVSPGRVIPYQFQTFSNVLDQTLTPNMRPVESHLASVMIFGIKQRKTTATCGKILMLDRKILDDDLSKHMQRVALESNYRKYGSFNQHKTLQNYALDYSPIAYATEIPVWDDDEENGMMGFMDLLVFHDNEWIIADFKPKASAEKPNKVLSQLWYYREMLYIRTGIKARAIYFDEHITYELWLPTQQQPSVQ